jgi:site-specific DNA recombinase
MSPQRDTAPSTSFVLGPDGEVVPARDNREDAQPSRARMARLRIDRTGSRVAIIYVRVSTPGQVRDGMSLENQVSMAREYCERNGLEVANVFVDKGITGASPDRPGLNKAISYCRSNLRVAHLVVLNQARWARNVEIVEKTFQEFHDLGVKVQSLMSVIDTESASGKLFYRIQAAQDSYLVDQLREVAKVVTGRLRGNGLVTHRAPFGYRNAREGRNSILVPDPDKAPLVRAVFGGIATGSMSIPGAYEYLRTIYVTGNDERPVSRASFYRMLRNPIYMAMVRQQDGSLVPGRFEPIIDGAEFQAVQQLLGRPHAASMGREGFLLAKRLFCAGCGLVLTTTEKTIKGRTYRYYHCRRSCGGMHFASRAMHLAVEEEMEKVSLDPALIELYGVVRSSITDSRAKALYSEKYACNRQIDRLDAKEELQRGRYLDGQLDKNSYEEAAARIQEQRRGVEDRLSRATEDIRKVAGGDLPDPSAQGAVRAAYLAGRLEDKVELLKVLYPEGIRVAPGPTIVSKPDEMVFRFGGGARGSGP